MSNALLRFFFVSLTPHVVETHVIIIVSDVMCLWMSVGFRFVSSPIFIADFSFGLMSVSDRVLIRMIVPSGPFGINALDRLKLIKWRVK
jgi:hypothetical protein